MNQGEDRRLAETVHLLSSPANTEALVDLDEIDLLLSQAGMLIDDHDGPEAATCDYVRAWCAPEHDRAVQAMRRLRERF